jgi:hypothetical protein
MVKMHFSVFFKPYNKSLGKNGGVISYLSWKMEGEKRGIKFKGK